MFEIVYFLKQEAPSRRSEKKENLKSKVTKSLAKQKLSAFFKHTLLLNVTEL